MKIEYYPIRGRGNDGLKFQLARIKDDSGNMFKGQYDQARHFASEDELKGYLAPVVGVSADSIELVKMNL
ncbi:MAG: hypothetical protein KJO62_00775 [Gammaproteobacteria bacterium]|nr:hypothetical protein [Gammaproteobacteria bacterium]NND38706.1 hypothetical protein [Pseudomonadales bacterium]NNL11957.1 hypothetical protein [Pseudomonadales bacterium]NNM10711.1 hypothetical protein [Pseudomonadales bacterium]